MDWAEITLQAITLPPLLDLLRWNFFWWHFTWRGSNFRISIFEGLLGKLKTIFELTENLSLVLTKLDTELGLAQPQLVENIFNVCRKYIQCILKVYSMYTVSIFNVYWKYIQCISNIYSLSLNVYSLSPNIYSLCI